MSSVSIQISGFEGIAENINRFSAGVRDRVLRKAATETARPIAEAAKMHCPVDLGTLRDSITYTVKSARQKGNVIIAIIGPKRRVKVLLGARTRGKKKGQPVIASPTKYAKLVEYGHATKSHRVPAKPFMRPAWDEEGGDVALQTFGDVLALGVADEAEKLNARNVVRAANGVPLL